MKAPSDREIEECFHLLSEGVGRGASCYSLLACRDVSAVLLAVPVDQIDGLVGAFSCLRDGECRRGHTEDAPASGDELTSIVDGCARSHNCEFHSVFLSVELSMYIHGLSTVTTDCSSYMMGYKP